MGILDTHLTPFILSSEQNYFRSGSSGSTIVAMMQATQPRHRCHTVTGATSSPRFATRGRSLFQRKMCAILVIVADVFVHQAFQMALIENDHVVEQVSAGSYPAFRNTVLPWTSEACPHWSDTEALQGFGHFSIELWASIKDKF